MSRGTSALSYHERTSHTPEAIRNNSFSLDFENKPIPYKIYENLPSVELSSNIRPSQLPTLRAITGYDADTDSRSDPEFDQHSPSKTRAHPLDRAVLTQLCYLSSGITKTIQRGKREIPFRAAACTGALYHINLYVICGSLPTLASGVYHFDPRTLSLDVLRRGDFRGALSEAGSAPLTIVATSTWWRNAWKYRARAYRHAFWDSGTVLANLLATAHALDIPARAALGFDDDRVADVLGIDPAHEGPIALVSVGMDEQVPDTPAIEPIDPDTRPLSEKRVEYELIQEAFSASTLKDENAVRDWQRTRPDSNSGTARGDGWRIDLEPVDDERAAKTPLHWTIRRRGSCRKYTRDPLSFRKVSTILDRAVRGVPLDVRDPSGPSLQFTDCYLLINDVQNVPSGAYHYHPDEGDGTIELLREGSFRREAGHLALDQGLAADAGLCAFFLSDIDAVTDQFGDRGYRLAQFEAALTAGRLYLAAYAHRDLGATGLTFYDEEVTEFFSPRAASQTPMFLWTLGRPA
ncbi:SagB/ThcOx family dehydrogenase [Halocatena marina]|uniref:SagB/ThcOx family dehydrogenase n=1 Tax=Halocatena marina TaxID=2934937 RepID=UPI00200E8C8A|nr:SagB/ThcOx family dehydrogenase [Halocatena marina]